MTPAERIDYLVVELALDNAKLFADKCRMSTSVVSKIRSGKSPLLMRHVDKICSAYPEVNRDWLAKGEGQPYPKKKAMSKSVESRIMERLDGLIERVDALEKMLRDAVEKNG